MTSNIQYRYQKNQQEVIYIKEYNIVLTNEVSEFYENLSKLLKKPVEEVICENLSKNMDLMITVLSLPK